MNRLTAVCVLALAVVGCSGPAPGTGGGAGGSGGGSAGGAGGGDGGATKCGNGTLETDELCEGFELRGRTCASEGFDLGQLRCSTACALDVSSCSKCGDGRISGAERCDSAHLDAGIPLFAGKSCASEVDAGAFGELDCADSCTRLSTAGCGFLPVRNEPCVITRGCTAGLICDLVNLSPTTFRCRVHCPVAGAGTGQGCTTGELCKDGTLEIEGATAAPPAYVYCAADGGCGAGFNCLDAGAGQVSLCGKRVGYCE